MNTVKYFTFIVLLFLVACSKNIVNDKDDIGLDTGEPPTVKSASLSECQIIDVAAGYIEITFSEDVELIDRNKIDIQGALVEELSLDGSILKVYYPQLKYNTEYELKFSVGAIKGITSQRYLQDYSLKFKTKEVELLELTGSQLWEVMKYGLFVHYVYGEEYGLMTPMSKNGGEPKDINEFTEKFNVEKFADDVAAMGFEYVIFTAWHANMNLLYPSEVMKKWRGPEHTSNRDLLGDLGKALKERGIYLMLYSHIWVGNDFHPKGDGYFYYGNTEGIITEDQENTGYVESVLKGQPPTKWDTFVNEVYDEMSSRYGDEVIGHWFDGTWCWQVDKKRIMATIERTNPGCAYVANGDEKHGLPYSSKEVNNPAREDYGFANDYPDVIEKDITTWPTYERNVALIQGGNWWASQWGQPKYTAEDIYRYTVVESGVNKGGGVSWAFAPFVNGEWEGDMLDIMKKVNSYISPVAESIKKTKPSTAFPTVKRTRINNLKRGYVATMSIDERYHYIHVLVPPEENFIILPKPADNSRFKKAILLKEKREMKLEELYDDTDMYKIILPGDISWNSLNTVIKLEK